MTQYTIEPANDVLGQVYLIKATTGHLTIVEGQINKADMAGRIVRLLNADEARSMIQKLGNPQRPAPAKRSAVT